uniref:TauD/TfdA-like domain-containing protein n=1 Tax=Araucaria cunninghamii TaxID=56994 RepID=A0A0D6R1C1_ARACU
MGGVDFFQETQTQHQKWAQGIPFPRVLIPATSSTGGGALTIGEVGEAIRHHKTWLESLLHSSGALLLRGFPINSAEDFNEVVEAFGYEELPYVGGAAPRTVVVGRVFTANESPPDQKIPFHHEMAQVPEYPAKLFFYCEVEPAVAGETPIVLSHLVYRKMADQFPDFVRKLEELGLLYIRILGEGDDASSPIGRGWHSTFLTKDKQEAEERATRLGVKVEWLEDGGVKTITGPLPAVKIDRSRNRKVWFNSMVAAYTGWKDARNVPENAVSFGDGTPLPKDVMLACLKILEDESVAFPWHRGDVLLLDNLAVLHSRRSFEPPRRILASLCK